MNRLPDTPFERLEPPPGGLAALRRRLDDEAAAHRTPRRSAGWRWAAATAAVAAAAAVITLVALPRSAPTPAAPTCGALCAAAWAEGDPSVVALGLAPTPEEPVSVVPLASGRLAVREVPTGRPDVVFYEVGVVAPTEP